MIMVEVKTAELSGEKWREIPGFPGYEASSLGRFRMSSYVGWKGKVHPPKIKSQRKDNRGYLLVKLKCKYYRAHRIVAITFIGNSSMPEINHKNGKKDDNRPENLEWCTQSQNAKHACDTGLWDRRGGINSRSFKGWVQAERAGFGVVLGGHIHLIQAGFSPSEVSKCLLGKRKTHKGHNFVRISKSAMVQRIYCHDQH